MATIKRNVTKEIKLLARERVGRVKVGKVIKSKKLKLELARLAKETLDAYCLDQLLK